MIAANEYAALKFSGGKDSLALLHLARPHLKNVTVFFANTGAVYPHVVSFVRETCKELGADLVTVEPFMPVQEFTERYGYPSDLVPTDLSPEMQWANTDKESQRLQSYFNCCGNMIWAPLQAAIKARGIKIILQGTKSCDPRVTLPAHKDADFEYRSPLWDWSDADVMEYLADKKQAAQYPAIMDSMDCWICTAHMTGQYAGAKLDYAKAHYPELWPEISRRVKAVRSTVTRERRKINAAFAAVS